eukprot:366475-Chlamydomonas_euryale.AAC.6
MFCPLVAMITMLHLVYAVQNVRVFPSVFPTPMFDKFMETSVFPDEGYSAQRNQTIGRQEQLGIADNVDKRLHALRVAASRLSHTHTHTAGHLPRVALNLSGAEKVPDEDLPYAWWHERFCITLDRQQLVLDFGRIMFPFLPKFSDELQRLKAEGLAGKTRCAFDLQAWLLDAVEVGVRAALEFARQGFFDHPLVRSLARCSRFLELCKTYNEEYNSGVYNGLRQESKQAQILRALAHLGGHMQGMLQDGFAAGNRRWATISTALGVTHVSPAQGAGPSTSSDYGPLAGVRLDFHMPPTQRSATHATQAPAPAATPTALPAHGNAPTSGLPYEFYRGNNISWIYTDWDRGLNGTPAKRDLQRQHGHKWRPKIATSAIRSAWMRNHRIIYFIEKYSLAADVSGDYAAEQLTELAGCTAVREIAEWTCRKTGGEAKLAELGWDPQGELAREAAKRACKTWAAAAAVPAPGPPPAAAAVPTPPRPPVAAAMPTPPRPPVAAAMPAPAGASPAAAAMPTPPRPPVAAATLGVMSPAATAMPTPPRPLVAAAMLGVMSPAATAMPTPPRPPVAAAMLGVMSPAATAVPGPGVMSPAAATMLAARLLLLAQNSPCLAAAAAAATTVRGAQVVSPSAAVHGAQVGSPAIVAGVASPVHATTAVAAPDALHATAAEEPAQKRRKMLSAWNVFNSHYAPMLKGHVHARQISGTVSQKWRELSKEDRDSWQTVADHQNKHSS